MKRALQKSNYDSEVEECHYGKFDFKITMLYDKKNRPLHGVVHLKKKDDALEIDLPVKRWPRKKKQLFIDFGPLGVVTIERRYSEEDIEDLKAEIMRRMELMNAIRRPKRSFLQMPDIAVLQFPELAENRYLDRLPEKIKKEIEEFLAEME